MFGFALTLFIDSCNVHCLCLFHSAVSIAAERHPLILGIPITVVCSVYEPHVFMMEMILTETNQTLATSRDTRISATLVPDRRLNGTSILCRAYTNDGLQLLQFENTKTLHVEGVQVLKSQQSLQTYSPIEFTHDVCIEMSPEVPVAGQRFSFICRVRSNLPATPYWRGPSGNISEMMVNRGENTISLVFDTLKMSHSGNYKCFSEVVFDSTDNFSSNVIQLEVKGML